MRKATIPPLLLLALLLPAPGADFHIDPERGKSEHDGSSGKPWRSLQEVVKRVPVGDHVIDFAARLARATRPKEGEAPDFVREMVGWGAGPRAGISLITAAKAHAVLRGRFHATNGDVAAVARPVLRHRVLTTFNAEAAGVTSDEIIDRLVKEIVPMEEIAV